MKVCGLVVRVSGYRYRGPGFDPPALPDFLSSSGSGTGSTQPREVNWGATWMKKSSGSRSRKQRLTAVETRCADHVTPLYPQKLALTSLTGGGRSVGIIRVRTKATEFSLVHWMPISWSQWPRGLRGRSTAASLLRLWVRIPPGVWMTVCGECCVLSGRGLCDALITRPEESYRLWCVVVCDLETSRMWRPWLALGRSARGWEDWMIKKFNTLHWGIRPMRVNKN